MKIKLCVVSTASLLACAGLARAQSIDWAAAVSGNWDVPANWSPADVPDAPGEGAVLGLAGPYTVTLNIDPTLDSVMITNTEATLNLGARTITTTGGVMSAGTIVANLGAASILGDLTLDALGGGVRVNAGQTLNLSGPTITNDSQILVNPTSSSVVTTLHFTADATLAGAGRVTLNALNGRATLSTEANVTLTNAASHTIAGWGNLNAALDNQGTVTADVAGQVLNVQSQNKVNSSVFKAENGGTLRIAGIEVDQAGGGEIVAESGPVELVGATIREGTIDGGAGGAAVMSGTSTVESVTLENAVAVVAGNTLVVIGSGAENNGELTVNHSTSAVVTTLRFDETGSLGGTGTVVLNGVATRAHLATDIGVTLTHSADHTIRGFGQIGAALVNNGLVSADVDGQTIVLNAEPKTNNATMQATGDGTLAISGIEVAQSELGLLLADGGLVTLSSAAVTGGVLDTDNGGAINTAGGTSTLTDVENLGAVNLIVGQRIDLAGDGFSNSGVVLVNPTASAVVTTLGVAPGLVISGPGEITLNGFGTRAHLVNEPAGTFTHAADHTIRGFGQVSAAMTNDGVIRADVTSQSLSLAAGAKTNSGLMEATNGSTLILSTTLVQDAGGQMAGNDGTLTFNDATVTGGSISTTGAGVAIYSGSIGTLTDVSLDSQARLNPGSTLGFIGAITNDGVFTVNPSNVAVPTTLSLADGATIDGVGEIVLAGITTRANIASAAGSAMHGATHTIRGRGQISAALTNNGLISADVAGNDLRLNVEPKTNNGMMRATGGGTLQLLLVTVDQTALGVMFADGSTVELDGASVSGGTIDGVAPGVIEVRGTSVLSGLTIDAPQTTVVAGQQLHIAGPVTGNGLITVNPTNVAIPTRVRFTQPTTIGGSGTITLGGLLTRSLLETDAGVTGTIGPDQTVGGIGQLEGTLIMEGTLAPGLSAGTLRNNADLTMAGSSTYAVEIASAGSADRIDGTGTFNAGGEVDVTLLDGFIPATNTTWTIVTSGAVNGKFDSLAAPNLGNPSFVWRLAYTPTSVRLGYVCLADWNVDGAVNTADFFEFFAAFFGSPPDADFNGDGATNTADFFEFFATFFGPPCV